MPTHTCEHPGCGYSTQKKSNLTLHELTHSDQTPWACSHEGCTFKTRQQSNLRNHLRTHSEERLYVCAVEECGYAAKTNGMLRQHTRAVHEKGESTQCPHCAYSSTQPRAVQEHVNAHLNIKPHQCQLCGFASAYRKHYLSHTRRCTGAATSRAKLLLPELAATALEHKDGDGLAL